MSTVYATKRFEPGKWQSMTRQQRDAVWEQLRATCAARAATQGMTCTTATKLVEESLIRALGDETAWEAVTTVIATDVTVSCDTIKVEKEPA